MKTYKTVAELLSKLTSGALLYSPMLGRCYYDRVKIDKDGETKISVLAHHNKQLYDFEADGFFMPTGEMMLKPARFNRDWNTLAWERGDMLTDDDGKYYIFREFAQVSDLDEVYSNMVMAYEYHDDYVGTGNVVVETDSFRLVTGEERDRIIAAIEEIEDGKFNEETLKVEKR